MIKTTLCAGAIALCVHLCAQYESTGARSCALAGTSTMWEDVWSAYNNTSALGFIKHTSIGIGYRNYYLIPQIGEYSVAAAIPTNKAGTFSAVLQRNGYEMYAANILGVGYARKLGKIFSLGVRLQMHWIHFGDVYGNKITASGAVSCTVKPIKNWVIAMQIYNITATPLSADSRDRINTTFNIGTAYTIAQKLSLAVECEASLQYAPACKVGIEYTPIKILSIRGGIQTYPLAPSFGFGIYFKKCKLDCAGKWNPVLGFSPVVSLHYTFEK